MFRVGLWTFRLLYFIPLGLLFVALGITTSLFQHTSFTAIPQGVATVFFVWLVLGRWIARWLVPLCISHLRCPGCSEDIDAIGVWRCGCGFRDHRERHVLAFRCPKCGEGFGAVDCPRCEATILF